MRNKYGPKSSGGFIIKESLVEYDEFFSVLIYAIALDYRKSYRAIINLRGEGIFKNCIMHVICKLIYWFDVELWVRRDSLVSGNGS